MDLKDKEILLSLGFSEEGGAYIMHSPVSNHCDEIEVILDDGCFHICHYYNSHKELGWQEEVYNRIREISWSVDTFLKTLEVLGIHPDWFNLIKNTIYGVRE
jgi:hypothetical protein